MVYVIESCASQRDAKLTYDKLWPFGEMQGEQNCSSTRCKAN